MDSPLIPNVVLSYINQQKRKKVFEKFLGKCAYCGSDISYTDMQVDHIEAKYLFRLFGKKDPDHIDNLFPACYICNHRKRAESIEQFRKILLILHTHKAFKRQCRKKNTEKKKQYILKLASQYLITPDNPFTGKFYFEKQTS